LSFNFAGSVKSFNDARRNLVGVSFLLLDNETVYLAVKRSIGDRSVNELLLEAGINVKDPNAIILDCLPDDCPIAYKSRVVFPSDGDAGDDRYIVTNITPSHIGSDGTPIASRQIAVLTASPAG
jgi:hypothetical protein